MNNKDKGLVKEFADDTAKSLSIEPVADAPTIKFALARNDGKTIICYASRVEDLVLVKEAFVAASMLAGLMFTAMADKGRNENEPAAKPEAVPHGV